MTQLQPQHLQNYYARALSQGWLDGKGSLSPRTVQYHHRILSEALSDAVKMGLVACNVAKAVDAPRPERKSMATLAPEDIPKFLEAAQETPYYIVFYTALYTGMRLGELLGLTWGNVDLDMASLSVVQALYKRSGVCDAIVERIMGLLQRIGIEETFCISGGVAKNIGVVKRLEEKLGLKAHIAFDAQIVGALGAALFARDQAQAICSSSTK